MQALSSESRERNPAPRNGPLVTRRAAHVVRLVLVAATAVAGGGCWLGDVGSVAPGVFGPPPAPTATATQQPDAEADIVARGAHGQLSRADVDAFVDALEFSLRQAGYAQPITDPERAQLADAVIRAFPQQDPETQVVLGDAPRIWGQVQQQWPTASEEDRRAFVGAVLTLAFGEAEPSASASVDSSGAATGGSTSTGACADFDACASKFTDPATQADTNAAMSCWASAGCNGYDAGSDTYSYDTPSYEPSYAPTEY